MYNTFQGRGSSISHHSIDSKGKSKTKETINDKIKQFNQLVNQADNVLGYARTFAGKDSIGEEAKSRTELPKISRALK
jgi:hypothetical protein